jgi:hypothetical protein
MENTIIAGEQTALLPTRTVEKPTPLPRLQMSVLMLLLFAEPITSQCIMPFINQVYRYTAFNQDSRLIITLAHK